MLPAIFSLKGLTVSPEERSLFKRANPVGFILFGKNKDVHNIDTPDQVRALIADLKDIVGRDCPVLVDQEGGRVARLNAPHWPTFKPFAYFGELYQTNPTSAREQLAEHTRGIAGILNDLGFNTNCSPVLDLRWPGAHDIIGDRAFSHLPAIISDLGDVVCRTYLECGITPILKHGPGHGRALSDSHLELPTVDLPVSELAETDFAPFTAISAKDYADKTWMMTAHILYPQIDPDLPATLSPTVMHDIIRQKIGYKGVVIGDDMDMQAIVPYGNVVARSMATLNAGCDLVLNCHGNLADMAALADGLPQIGDESRARLAA